MSYSTERQQIKRKTTHRDHRWNHSKRGLRLLEAGSPQRHLLTQDSRACTVSGPATTLNDRPKSASLEVFRVDNWQSCRDCPRKPATRNIDSTLNAQAIRITDTHPFQCKEQH